MNLEEKSDVYGSNPVDVVGLKSNEIEKKSQKFHENLKKCLCCRAGKVYF